MTDGMSIAAPIDVPTIDVLVLGGGGREHALCWKIRQSPRTGRIVCAPGNAGSYVGAL